MKTQKVIIGFFVAFTVTLAIIIVAVLTSHRQDRGAIQGEGGIVVGWPALAPIEVVSDGRVPARTLTRAADWWESRVPGLSFAVSENPDRHRALESGPVLERFGTVLVTAENLAEPEDERVGGKTLTLYEVESGQAVTATITMNELNAYGDAILTAALVHELGHVLGLDDDEPPCFSSNSIMCRKLLPGGQLTSQDRSILTKRWKRPGAGLEERPAVGGPLQLRHFAPQRL